MKALIIDDQKSIRDGLAQTLGQRRHQVTLAADGRQGIREYERGGYDLVFLDLRMPGIDGLETLKHLKTIDPDVVVVIITAYPSIDTVVQAFRRGAYDFLSKPFSLEEVDIITARVEERRQLRFENEKLRRQLRAVAGEACVISGSPAMREVNALIAKVARTESNVLLTGESGTGKEVAARTICALSRRSDRELVTVDCSTLAGSLLESELFGHVKGGFTGASERKRGLLELADGGTFFLDEVGNLSLSTQAKLLRVVQEGEIKPVGAEFVRKVDIRLIAATNADLVKAVKEGSFREDLFYRLAVFPIHMPPLRERAGDIPELCTCFVAKYAALAGKRIEGLSPECLAVLTSYSFPGNIRELENIIQRAVIIEDSPVVRLASLPPHLLNDCHPDKSSFVPLRDVEKDYIRLVLQALEGQKSPAARVLGIDRKTLYRKIKEYGLD